MSAFFISFKIFVELEQVKDEILPDLNDNKKIDVVNGKTMGGFNHD